MFVEMAYQFSDIVAWLGIMICCCHMLRANEIAQYTNSNILESSLDDTHFTHNTSSTAKAALMSIFAKYGQNGSLSFEGFQHLLESLGLGDIAVSEHIAQHHSGKASWSVTLATDDHQDHHDHHGDEESHVSDGGSDLDNDDDIHQHHTSDSSAVSADRLSAVVNQHFVFNYYNVIIIILFVYFHS